MPKIIEVKTTKINDRRKRKEMEAQVKIYREALGIISDGRDEILEYKKPIFDKRNNQISIKIPRIFALKNNLSKDTVFEIIHNPKEDAIERAKESGFILFPKKNDGEKTEVT